MTPIQLTHRNQTLRGIEHNPDSTKGTVLLVHGFGNHRFGPGRLLVDMGRALANAGLRVLAFDRLGHGESDGDFFDINVPDEITQLSAMADLVDGPLHMLGHSLGGMELGTLAGQRPDKLASLTLWAPAAASVDDIANGEVHGQPVDPLQRGEALDFNGQALGPAFLGGMQGYDAYAGITAYTGPVHLHHGTDDPVVDPSYSRRYADLWTQAVLTTYDETGHGWENLQARQRLIDTSLTQICAV